MNYIYTAVFTFEGNKVFARVPDLPGCITSGKNLNDAIDQITDAASLYLVTAEDEGDDIPAPTDQSKIPFKEGQSMSLILIDTFAYRAKIDNRAVRKNVSLPSWMAKMADKQKVNYSKVLQAGLMKQLNA